MVKVSHREDTRSVHLSSCKRWSEIESAPDTYVCVCVRDFEVMNYSQSPKAVVYSTLLPGLRTCNARAHVCEWTSGAVQPYAADLIHSDEKNL